MKSYIVYFRNPDTNGYDQFFGVFEDRKKLREEINKFSKKLRYKIPKNDYEIVETTLNKTM